MEMVHGAIIAMMLSTGSWSEISADDGNHYRKILASSSANSRNEDFRITSAEAAPECPFPWSIQKTTLHGGRQEGVELIEIDNGKLKIILVPTRGLGVLSVTMGDLRLGWNSPVKEVVHPSFVNLQSRGGLGWLEGFNEWMCRCGLESNGHPGTDKFIDNVGNESSMELTLHGKIANIPANEVQIVAERKAPFRIAVRGEVNERMFYGPKFELETSLSTVPGSVSFSIADTVKHHGSQPQEFELLYHCNYGAPLLGEGATFVAPVERLTPFNAHAASGLSSFDQYQKPTVGFIEQVYCMRVFAKEDGQTLVLLKNAAGDRGTSIGYSVKQLPYLTLWKNTAGEADGYVTGIEPGTNFPANRRIERKYGRVPVLKPGDVFKAELEFSLLGDASAVSACSAQIDAIRSGRTPTVDPEPEKKE